MINKNINVLTSLTKQLYCLGYKKYANYVKKVISKAIATKCIAAFKNPIQLSMNDSISYFEYNVSSPNQMLAAIPLILSKKHNEVWFLQKRYQLPAHNKLLSIKLIEEKNAGNIICECYLE